MRVCRSGRLGGQFHVKPHWAATVRGGVVGSLLSAAAHLT